MKKISLLVAGMLAATNLLTANTAPHEADKHDLELHQLAAETAKTLGLPATDKAAVEDIYTILKDEATKGRPAAATAPKPGLSANTITWITLGSIVTAIGLGFGGWKGYKHFWPDQPPSNPVPGVAAEAPAAGNAVHVRTEHSGDAAAVGDDDDNSETGSVSDNEETNKTRTHAPSLGNIGRNGAKKLVTAPEKTSWWRNILKGFKEGASSKQLPVDDNLVQSKVVPVLPPVAAGNVIPLVTT